METLKIAITSEFFHPDTGGAEQSALELSKAMKRKGHEVIVYTRGEGESEDVEGIKVERILNDLKKGTINRDVPFPRVVDRKEENRLFKELEGKGFDILHSNNRDTAIFTALAASKLGITSVAHIRDYWPLCPKRDFLRPEGTCHMPKGCGNCMARYFKAWHKAPFYYKMWTDTWYRWQELRNNVDYYIYNSNYTQGRIHLAPGKVIYNPVDLDLTRSGEKENGKVLFVGNVTERKGVKILAEAVKGLDVTLHIIGDGYLLPRIEGENIVKHGRVEYQELLTHLSDAEMMVVPSLWPEPFGRAAVEGMAAGLPVVVTPVGGLPEVVGDGGFILDGITIDGLRKTIQKLHDDESLRKKMGAKGKERSKIFHPDRIADQTITLYKELLSN